MNSKKIANHLLLLLLLWGAMLSASDMNIDYCRFAGEENQVYLELYVSISRHVLVHQADSSGWYAAALFDVRIFSDSVLQAEDKWRIADRADNPGDINSLQKLVDLRIYELQPGRYDFRVYAKDSLSSNTWADDFQVDITEFASDRLTVSDIQIAGYLLPGKIIDKYDRGGFSMIPSTDLIFGKIRPYFYYYIEVYPEENEGDSLDFRLNRYVLNGARDTVVVMGEKLHTADKPFTDIDSVSLENLSGDSYTFIIEVSTENGDTVVREKRFFVFRSDISSSREEWVFRRDSAGIERDIDMVEVLFTRNMFRLIKKLNSDQKIKLLQNLWDAPQPESPKISKRRVKNPIAKAQRKWETLDLPGRKTDIGRILFVYGKPDRIEDHPLDRSTKSYVIWNYDYLEGGVSFFFVDRNGQGEFILVHSTMEGEIDQPDFFEAFVKRSGINPRR